MSFTLYPLCHFLPPPPPPNPRSPKLYQERNTRGVYMPSALKRTTFKKYAGKESKLFFLLNYTADYAGKVKLSKASPKARGNNTNANSNYEVKSTDSFPTHPIIPNTNCQQKISDTLRCQTGIYTPLTIPPFE